MTSLSNYEEAAKAYASKPTLYTDIQKMKTDFFLAGISHAAQEEHNRGWNEAINAAINELSLMRDLIEDYRHVIQTLEKMKV